MLLSRLVGAALAVEKKFNGNSEAEALRNVTPGYLLSPCIWRKSFQENKWKGENRRRYSVALGEEGAGTLYFQTISHTIILTLFSLSRERT